jgi:hypothetical protein
MGGIDVQTRTQRIVVSSQQRIVVDDKSVNVQHSTTQVNVIPAGPQGPPGVQGIQGEPGLDSGVVAEAMMIAHVEAPTPHPAYDDMPNLKLLFENGLL